MQEALQHDKDVYGFDLLAIGSKLGEKSSFVYYGSHDRLMRAYNY